MKIQMRMSQVMRVVKKKTAIVIKTTLIDQMAVKVEELIKLGENSKRLLRERMEEMINRSL